jgi:hypothetical protein
MVNMNVLCEYTTGISALPSIVRIANGALLAVKLVSVVTSDSLHLFDFVM